MLQILFILHQILIYLLFIIAFIEISVFALESTSKLHASFSLAITFLLFFSDELILLIEIHIPCRAYWCELTLDFIVDKCAYLWKYANEFVFPICFSWENEESAQPVKFIFVINCWRRDWVCCNWQHPYVMKMTNATERIMISIFQMGETEKDTTNRTRQWMRRETKPCCERTTRAKGVGRCYSLRIFYKAFLDWIFLLGVMSVQHNNALCCQQRECHNNGA